MLVITASREDRLWQATDGVLLQPASSPVFVHLLQTFTTCLWGPTFLEVKWELRLSCPLLSHCSLCLTCVLRMSLSASSSVASQETPAPLPLMTNAFPLLSSGSFIDSGIMFKYSPH